MSIPARSAEQRLDALGRANEVRSVRAELKDEIKHGRAIVADVLIEPPAYVETMRVFDLLMAAPGLGSVRVNKLLGECQVSPNKKVGGLSERQRNDLARRTRRATVRRSRVH